jgi:hypothetical protein
MDQQGQLRAPAVFRRKKDGAYMVQDAWGGPPHRLRTKQDFEALNLSGLVRKLYGNEDTLDKQGVSNFERFTAKNFIENPEVTKEFLGKTGKYIISQYGSGPWDFAVKPKDDPSSPWTFIDPKNGGAAEAVKDILDLTWDAVEAGALTATAMTPVGGVATGPVAAGLETAKQGIAKGLGVPQEMDPMAIGFAGLMGQLASPSTGRVVNTMAKAGVEGAGEFAAMMTRAGRSGRLSSADTYKIRVSKMYDPLTDTKRYFKATENLPSVEDAADKILERLSSAHKTLPQFEQKKMAAEIESKLFDSNTGQGLFIDFGPVLNDAAQILPTATGSPRGGLRAMIKLGTQATGNPAGQVEETLGIVDGILKEAGASENKVPLPLAVKIKSMLQKRSKTLGGLTDVPKEKLAITEHETLSGKWKEAIADAVDSEMGKSGMQHQYDGKFYSGLMEESHKLMTQFEEWVSRTGADKYARNKVEAREQAISFIKSLSAENGHWRLMNDMEKRFGYDIGEVAIPAKVGTMIGDQGRMGILPKITSTGGIPLIAEAGGGVIQAGVGLSPRMVTRYGQAADKLAGAFNRMVPSHAPVPWKAGITPTKANATTAGLAQTISMATAHRVWPGGQPVEDSE